MAIPAEIDEVAGEGAFFAPVSLEQTDLLERDAVVWVTATEEEIAEVQGLEVLQGLTISREGRQVFTDFTTNGAFSFSSPLSIPYLVDTLVPQLAAAVDGDPATAVEGAATR
jgi:iron complex transport system substrate-binding protein